MSKNSDEITTRWDFTDGFRDAVAKNWDVGTPELVELDFAVPEPVPVLGKVIPWPVAPSLTAFLAHPITDLDPASKPLVNSVNRTIIQTLDSVYSQGLVWYDPEEHFDPKAESHTDVFPNDLRMLFWSDVLIVNAFTSADGIGMLVLKAVMLNIPVVILRPAERIMSAMYDGLPIAPVFVDYSSEEELREKLPNVFRDLLPRIRARHREQTEERSTIRENVPGQTLCARRVASSYTLGDLSAQTGFSCDFLYSLEMDSSFLLMLTQPAQKVIFTAFGVQSFQINDQGFRVGFDSPEVPRSTNATTSLNNLVSFFFNERQHSNYCHNHDRALVGSWRQHSDEIAACSTRDPRGGVAATEVVPIECDVTKDGRIVRRGWKARFEAELHRSREPPTLF